MNLPIGSESEAEQRLAELEAREQARAFPPVMVLRNDELPLRILLRFDSGGSSLRWRILLEDGQVLEGAAQKDNLEMSSNFALSLKIERNLPLGYHRPEIDQMNARIGLIVAPPRCWMAMELGSAPALRRVGEVGDGWFA